jgi:UDP-3-O-[3-hydroxymyristoyl] glucosamine N-acyltransferase
MAQVLEELARHVSGRVVGDGGVRISSAASLQHAQAGQISFLANPRYTKLAETTKASALVVGELVSTPAAQILVKNPYYAFVQIMGLLHGARRHPVAGISKLAAVHPSATVGEGAHIHNFVTVSERVRIGQRCVIYPGVFIGPDTEIGDDCVLYANVVVFDGVRIGHRVSIQANSTIGEEGFGYTTHERVHHPIPHLARVILEDDVAIGANCGVQRGVLVDTVVGRGTKVGDLVVIGHGVHTGPGCLIATQSGVAGSTTLGEYCVLAAQVGVVDNLKIGNRVVVGARAAVFADLEDDAKVWGTPAFDLKEAKRAYPLLRSLPEYRKALRDLECRLTELEKSREPAAHSEV